MTELTPIQRAIADADATLTDLDAAMDIFDRLCADKLDAIADTPLEPVCAWCAGPCHCTDYDEAWPLPDGYLDAMADARAACPECAAERAYRLAEQARVLLTRLDDAAAYASDPAYRARAASVAQRAYKRMQRRVRAARLAYLDTPPQPAPDARPVTPTPPPPAAAVQPADDPRCPDCGDVSDGICPACREWRGVPYALLVM